MKDNELVVFVDSCLERLKIKIDRNEIDYDYAKKIVNTFTEETIKKLLVRYIAVKLINQVYKTKIETKNYDRRDLWMSSIYKWRFGRASCRERV